LTPKLFDQRCFKALDSTTTQVSAFLLLRGTRSRDLMTQIARLAEQFIELNHNAFHQLDLSVEAHYRNSA